MRVLIVNSLLVGENSATGNTLYNIFEDMDGVEILQYSLVPLKYVSAESKICTISESETNLLGSFIYKHHKVRISSGTPPISANFLSKKNYLTQNLKKFALHLNELYPIRISPQNIAIVRNFAPQVIYTLGADCNVFRICLKLSYLLNIPIVVHCMDDFYNMKYTGNSPIERLLYKKLRNQYREVYTRSYKSLTIGPVMKNEYEKCFGIPFDWAMNCIDSELSQEISEKYESDLLIFSGGLHGGRADTLKKIADIIDGSQYKLEIYTSNSDLSKYSELFKNFRNTSIHNYVSRNEMFTNLSRAEILVHVESFDKENIRYFRLSMSTKIPEYILCLRPLLCVGPNELASVSYISNSGCGETLGDCSEINGVIEKIKRNRNDYIENEKLELKRFDKKSVQKTVYSVLKTNIRLKEGNLS